MDLETYQQKEQEFHPQNKTLMLSEQANKSVFRCCKCLRNPSKNSHHDSFLTYCTISRAVTPSLLSFDSQQKLFRSSKLTVTINQWFPNCGTRSTSGTRRLSRWYTNRPTFCFSRQNIYMCIYIHSYAFYWSGSVKKFLSFCVLPC